MTKKASKTLLMVAILYVVGMAYGQQTFSSDTVAAQQAYVLTPQDHRGSYIPSGPAWYMPRYLYNTDYIVYDPTYVLQTRLSHSDRMAAHAGNNYNNGHLLLANGPVREAYLRYYLPGVEPDTSTEYKPASAEAISPTTLASYSLLAWTLASYPEHYPTQGDGYSESTRQQAEQLIVLAAAPHTIAQCDAMYAFGYAYMCQTQVHQAIQLLEQSN